MANLIDILINAKWTGSQAVTQASGDMRSLGNAAAASSVEMAAVQARSRLLGTALSGLGEKVALGELTTAQATEAYKQYESQLVNVSAAAPKAGLGLSGLATSIFAVTAALTAVTVAAKKFGQALVEGAELEATAIRFDRLADSIGTTGDALRQDLGIVTRGLLSDMEAMASATDFLALGLADTHDEAVRLTSVASQLGFNMNQLVLTLTNQTTMRFDALGVSVAGFEDKVKTLEEAGYSASEAFTEAFLLQAEEQIERVGSRADTTAGQIDILTSAIDDLKNSAKLALAEGAGPFISFLVNNLVAASDAESALAKYQNTLADTGATAEEQKEVNEDLIASLEGLTSAQSQLASKITGLGAPVLQARQIIAEYAVSIAETKDSLDGQIFALEEAGFAVNDFGISIAGVTVGWNDFNEALKESRITDITAEVKGADEVLKNYIYTLEKFGESDFIPVVHIPIDDIKKLAEFMGITVTEARKLVYEFDSLSDAVDFIDKLDKPEEFLSGLRDGLTEAFSGEGLVSIFETAQERAQKFLDFQDDLTDISSREGELRAEAEEQYEQRRTELAANFGLRRVQDEQDFNRQRARQDAQLQASIDKTRADSADREIDLKERANKRLVELEQDHLDRMTDIVKSADLQLIQAAGKLDAASLVSIQQQRDAALKSEEKSYADSRENIKEQLAEQIEAEREAARERIAALEAANAERQRIEDEDRAIRLQREKDAFDLRIAEYDRQEQERLDQIKEQTRDEIQAREDEYEKLYTSLEDIGADKMADILKAEAAWWDDRLGLVPSGNGAQGFNPLGAMFPGQGGGTNVGGITVNVAGGGSPAETGDAVRDALIQLFGGFQ